jgi:hypothetical protein
VSPCASSAEAAAHFFTILPSLAARIAPSPKNRGAAATNFRRRIHRMLSSAPFA